MMKLNDVLTRLIVAFIAIPVIFSVTYFGNIPFLIFISLITTFSQIEFRKFFKAKSIDANFFIGIFVSLAILLLFYFHRTDLLLALIFMLIVLVTIPEMFRRRNNSILNCSGSVFAPLFFGLFFGSLIGIREFFGNPDSLDYIKGFYLVWTILAAIWICDSAAYFGGSALGKHRLFERISPKKSWEGAIFGFIFSIISVVIAKLWFLDFFSWMDTVFIGLIVGVIGQIGDLVESMFKRNANIKDSSTIIPGHGGIYDRFDSLLFVAPFVYFYLIYFY